MKTIREALPGDFYELHSIRVAVTENILPDPDMITAADYELYITEKGKGWVYEEDGRILGFSIVDLDGNNVWALFVKPGYEGVKIGKSLHHTMLEWYFAQTKNAIWLSTAPKSRAEKFYRMQGWKETGIERNGDIRFELTEENWIR